MEKFFILAILLLIIAPTQFAAIGGIVLDGIMPLIYKGLEGLLILVGLGILVSIVK